MKKRILFWIVIYSLSIACKNREENPTPNQDFEVQKYYEPSTVLKNPKAEPSYKEDTSTDYEYRIGKPGHYTYNYDVMGQDLDGNEVRGTITIKNKYGNGKLTDSKGVSFSVIVEWVGYGKLLAQDEDGNEYNLVTQ
jgi:hypothetical protein